MKITRRRFFALAAGAAAACAVPIAAIKADDAVWRPATAEELTFDNVMSGTAEARWRLPQMSPKQ